MEGTVTTVVPPPVKVSSARLARSVAALSVSVLTSTGRVVLDISVPETSASYDGFGLGDLPPPPPPPPPVYVKLAVTITSPAGMVKVVLALVVLPKVPPPE